MKIFIFFGFSSDSILDKVKDTIKNQNSQEKTHKSVNLVNRSIGQSVNRSIGKFCQFCQSSILSIFSALYLEGADFFVHLQTEMS
jgi:hypothetical protein